MLLRKFLIVSTFIVKIKNPQIKDILTKNSIFCSFIVAG